MNMRLQSRARVAAVPSKDAYSNGKTLDNSESAEVLAACCTLLERSVTNSSASSARATASSSSYQHSQSLYYHNGILISYTFTNSSGSVEDCVTRICKSTTSTEVTLDGHLIACAIRHGHRSYKTPVPVYPDRLLVYHELVPCCWNSSMKETRCPSISHPKSSPKVVEGWSKEACMCPWLKVATGRQRFAVAVFLLKVDDNRSSRRWNKAFMNSADDTKCFAVFANK
ncbi:Large-conductance mechanosensitive channel [Trichinella pseudospiralis]